MSKHFDALLDWSKTIEGSQFEDSTSEIELNRGRRVERLPNQMIMVNGDRDGVRFVVTWTDYMQEGFDDNALVYDGVLDVLATNKEQMLEGELHERGMLGKLLAMIGIGGGWKPVSHGMFGEYRLDKSEVHGTTCFEKPGYCDKLFAGLVKHKPWKIQYQEKSGVDVFFQDAKLSNEWLDAVVDFAVTATGREG